MAQKQCQGGALKWLVKFIQIDDGDSAMLPAEVALTSIAATKKDAFDGFKISKVSSFCALCGVLVELFSARISSS